MSLYIDLTEFLKNPITTGIQRISGEMCKYLPGNAVIPLWLKSGRYVALPTSLIGRIGTYFSEGIHSAAADIYRLREQTVSVDVKPSQDDTVLIPEVFGDPERLDFFGKMPEEEFRRYRFIVYDLLPLTHPEHFWADMLGVWEYYRILRRANNCAFISEDTSDLYHGRLKRSSTRDGVVLPLGCDSLGPRVSRPALNRPLTFSVLGTIEPRKNHELILDAFAPLLKQVKGLRLQFIGKMGWVSPEFSQKVHSLAADKNSGFTFHSAPGDEAIKSYIEESRATIYVSVAEGYGLPPVESLWCGTPVIASRTIPSLKRLGSPGIHYVDPLNVVNLRRAVLAFLDDEYANRKTEEAATVNLPTWRSFTDEVLRWCRAGSQGRSALA
jgi:glycosyltransferase involved in cell wall biosynthesis